MDKIHAPFTPEQVAALNAFQQSGQFHPFTCGTGRGTPEWLATHLDGEGVLVATADGWVCPFCPYRQNYALAMMAEKREQ